MMPNRNRQGAEASPRPQFANLKPWRVCRLIRRFNDLGSANAYATAFDARFVHIMPEANGEASAWELEYHCEREHTARARLAELDACAPPNVRFAVFRDGGVA